MLRLRAWSGLLLALTLVGIASSAPVRAGDRDGPEGVVYVESNIGTSSGNNAIFAFRRDGSGHLSAISGSPFRTAGTGVGPTFELGPYDSDQNLIADEEGRLLFAVNGGSNTIAVFQIHKNGTLQPVQGSPFPSGGVNPVSVGLAGRILCVVNKNMDPNQDPAGSLPNYTNFLVTRHGRLIPLPHSTIFVGQGSSPSQALIAPDNRLAFGADFLGGLLQSFVILPNGRLYQNMPLPLPASEFPDATTPRLGLGLAAHPRRRVLYVGFVTINKMGVYTYDLFGRLRFVRSVPDSGVAICWITSNARGSRLYATNTGDDSVSVFDATDPLNPVEIQKLTLEGPSSSPFQVDLDRDGEFLYVVTQRADPSQTAEANALHALKVHHDGTLEQVDRVVLPVPEGARPQGVVAF